MIMEELFLECLNLSIRASYMILAVLLIRMIFAKAGRKYMVWLWIMVGIRLIFPFSFSALPSVLPHTEVIPTDIAVSQSPQIASGFEAVDQAVNPVLQQNFAPAPENSVNPLQVVTAFASAAWIAGILFMFGYMIVSSLWLRKEIRRSGTPVHGVFESSDFEAPFVFGMFRPVICLPPCEEEKKNMILLHERTHIERKDHILKPLAFIILSVYWFHPLVWIAYRLLCRDIEMACDETVIQKMERKERSSYAQTLLECASEGQIAAAPVAFGETDVKKRIRNILKYRKPSALLAAGLLVCASLICAGCFADQESKPQETPDSQSKDESGNKQDKENAPVVTVETLVKDPAPYVDTYVYVEGNLPQSASGTDEKGNPVLYLNGAEDLDQRIRIVNYIPQDSACKVKAYGTVIKLDNGETALSMEGYEIESEPSVTVLTVETLISNASAYIDKTVRVQGNLPQSMAGFDENGEPILYLAGVQDLDQHIRIVDYTPKDGACLVEATGKILYLDNGDLAISMDGYTIMSQPSVQPYQPPEQPSGTSVITVESLLQNPSAYANTYVHIQGNLPQSIAGYDSSGNAILYLCGVNDTDQHIRIVNYNPQDGSCLVEATGTIVWLSNGDLAISMDGYTVLSQQSAGTPLTVETVLQSPSAYVNTYVYVQGNLPQSISGFDASGNAILYLCGVNDRGQKIRIIDYKPSDGNCLVEASGTLMYLDNGELAISMDGYTVLE